MSLPIAKVQMPSDLSGKSNGNLPSNLLTPIGSGKLHHLAARAFGALYVHAIDQADLHLTATYGGWYRSYEDQEALFRRRYSPSGAGGGCKTWQGQRWCKLDSGLATAATPGKSNHGWGLAIDTAYDSDLSDGVGSDDAAYIKGHPGWEWLLKHAEEFGFSWELQSEPWHIRYVAGDNIPQKVLEWEAFAAALEADDEPSSTPDTPTGIVKPPAPTPEPAPSKYGLWPLNTSKPILKDTPPRQTPEENREAIRYLQAVLKNECRQRITIDGWFGSQTELAVRNLQQFFGLQIDGIVGRNTWSVIDWLASL